MKQMAVKFIETLNDGFRGPSALVSTISEIRAALPILRAPRKITFSPGNNGIQAPWKDLMAYFAALDPAYPRKR
jgi:hypothetical protein